MKGKNIKNPQLNVFRVPLVSVIDMEHELVLLAQTWIIMIILLLMVSVNNS